MYCSETSRFELAFHGRGLETFDTLSAVLAPPPISGWVQWSEDGRAEVTLAEAEGSEVRRRHGGFDSWKYFLLAPEPFGRAAVASGGSTFPIDPSG